MSKFSAKTTADEAATAFSEQIRSKSVLVTGVSPENLGSEFILSVSAHSPSLIILAGRKLSNLNAVEDVTKTSHPSVPTRLLRLDLSSQANIREAATEVAEYKERIDVLVNNAAIMACPYGKIVAGVATQFGVNHTGPFLFTNFLLMREKLGEGARIVVVSSEAHHLSPVNFEDTNLEGKNYDGGKSYGKAKTANILFAFSLARKLRKKGMTAFSLHPGATATNLLSDSHGSNEACAEYAKNEDNAEKLWKLSEDVVSEKFEV